MLFEPPVGSIIQLMGFQQELRRVLEYAEDHVRILNVEGQYKGQEQRVEQEFFRTSYQLIRRIDDDDPNGR